LVYRLLNTSPEAFRAVGYSQQVVRNILTNIESVNISIF